MKKDLLLFSIIFIILISFMIFPMRHCISGQDSLTYHLPVARYIAENNAIPDQIPYCYQTDNPEDTEMKKEPLLYLLTYPFFKLFGVSDCVAHVIPLIFSCSTILLLLYWVKKENGLPEILAVLLLIPMFFLNNITWYYQETILIFFTSAFFFSLYYYIKTKNIKYLYFLIIVSILAGVSKISGMIFVFYSIIISLVVMIKYKRYKLIAILLILTIIPILWYFTKDNAYTLTSISTLINNFKIIDGEFIINFIPLIFIYPLILLYRYKGMSKEEKTFNLIWLSLFLITFFITRNTRHFLFIYVVPLVFTSIFISDIISYVKNIKIKNSIRVIISVIVLLIILSIFITPHYDRVWKYEKAVNYLTSIYPAPKNIAVDSDFGACWYGKYNTYKLIDGVNKHGVNFVDVYNISYIIDSWWNFCSIDKELCENKYLSMFNLTLVYDDKENKIYKTLFAENP